MLAHRPDDDERVSARIRHNGDYIPYAARRRARPPIPCATTARSKISSSGGTSTGCTICGKHFKIPFTVLTFMAMSVPIVMLLITALIPMATAAQDLVTVEGFNGLAAEVSNCVSAMSLGKADAQ